MPVTIDPVDNGLNFVAVVLLGEQIVRCPVRLVQLSGSSLVRAAVDPGSKVIVDTFARRTGQGQVGGMLIRPRGQQMLPVSYLENRVYFQIFLGVDGSQVSVASLDRRDQVVHRKDRIETLL